MENVFFPPLLIRDQSVINIMCQLTNAASFVWIVSANNGVIKPISPNSYAFTIVNPFCANAWKHAHMHTCPTHRWIINDSSRKHYTGQTGKLIRPCCSVFLHPEPRQSLTNQSVSQPVSKDECDLLRVSHCYVGIVHRPRHRCPAKVRFSQFILC